MEYYKKLLDQNKEWVKQQLAIDPEVFNNLSKGQAPPVLWIGCSDSRVPANQITGTMPGEIFVHRNIANVVVHSDMNMLSVLDYAVNHLKVSHVIVCGHYNCGGVNAAMSNKDYGIINNWLLHLKDVYRIYQQELDAILDEEQRGRRFVELNVKEQVYNLLKTSIIQQAWNDTQLPYIHGWVYDIKTGIIKDLDITSNNQQNITDSVFKFNHNKE
ncbi:MAG: carbonic anhydrase [Chitinophagaceae bacterium]